MSMEQQMYADNVALRSELLIEQRNVLFEKGKVQYADKLIDEYRSRINVLEMALEKISKIRTNQTDGLLMSTIAQKALEI